MDYCSNKSCLEDRKAGRRRICTSQDESPGMSATPGHHNADGNDEIARTPDLVAPGMGIDDEIQDKPEAIAHHDMDLFGNHTHATLVFPHEGTPVPIRVPMGTTIEQLLQAEVQFGSIPAHFQAKNNIGHTMPGTSLVTEHMQIHLAPATQPQVCPVTARDDPRPDLRTSLPQSRLTVLLRQQAWVAADEFLFYMQQFEQIAQVMHYHALAMHDTEGYCVAIARLAHWIGEMITAAATQSCMVASVCLIGRLT